MMKIVCAVLMLTAVAGCSQGAGPGPSWDTALSHYRCTEQQLKLVKEQTAICSKTKYFSDYCFNVAVKAQCTKIDAPDKANGDET